VVSVYGNGVESATGTSPASQASCSS